MMRCAGNPGVSLDYNGARRLRCSNRAKHGADLGAAWIGFGVGGSSGRPPLILSL